MRNFNEDVYPEIINKLKQNTNYFTKTTGALNKVMIQEGVIMVQTNRSKPDYKEIQRDLFEETWDLLVEYNQISQYELSKIYNIKRSAFMLIAFDLLDFVKYDSEENSLVLVK